jgi:hypothetical protein
MTLRITIGILAGLGIPTCGLIASLKTFEMVGKVNDRLPKAEQFDLPWWYLSNRQPLVREYKQLYPGGHLLTHCRIAMFLGAAFLLVFAWAFRVLALLLQISGNHLALRS